MNGSAQVSLGLLGFTTQPGPVPGWVGVQTRPGNLYPLTYTSKNVWVWVQKKVQKCVDEELALLEAEKARAHKSHVRETEGAGPSHRRDE